MRDKPDGPVLCHRHDLRQAVTYTNSLEGKNLLFHGVVRPLMPGRAYASS